MAYRVDSLIWEQRVIGTKLGLARARNAVELEYAVFGEHGSVPDFAGGIWI